MKAKKKSRSKKQRKARAFRRKILRQARVRGLRPIDIYAERMRTKPPKSDAWFQEQWAGLKDEHDEYNVKFHGLIPDCINHNYKYVIEVDGSIHSRPDVLKRDAKKDKIYESHGYAVFRITAFDNDAIDPLFTYVDQHKLRFLLLARERAEAAIIKLKTKVTLRRTKEGKTIRRAICST